MVDVFCNDDGSNTAPHETWAKAATTFATAVAALSAGDRLILGHDHSEDPGGITYAFPGTAAAPNLVISATSTAGGSTVTYNKADNVQLDNSASAVDINLSGYVQFYGVSFKVGDDFTFSGVSSFIFDDSVLELTGANSKFNATTSIGKLRLELRNSDINFSGGGVSGGFRFIGNMIFNWFGGLYSITGTQPGALFDGASRTVTVNLAGVDFSALSSAFFDVSDESEWRGSMHHCLLHSSVSLITGIINNPTQRIIMSGCDDTTGNNLYRLEYVDFWGSTVHDDAIFLSDADKRSSDGTTPISWKMVSTANAREFSEPTTSPPIFAWVDSTGSKTFKIHGVWDSATDIQDDEIRIRVEFLEASADTDSAFADDGPADITATPADQTTNAESWTVSPSMTNENTFEISVTKTVNRVGPVICWIELMKPSTTVFMNAKVEIT